MSGRKWLTAVTFALATSANAALVDGGTYVRDSATGLDWLKLSHVNGYSYEQVMAGAGGYTTSGWRYATQSELLSLMTRYVGAQNGAYGQPVSGLASAYFASTYDFVLALGMNIAFNDSRATYNIVSAYYGLQQISVQGFFDDGNSADPWNGLAEVTAVIADPGGIYDYLQYDSVPLGRWLIWADSQEVGRFGPNISSFLVRPSSSVPTPGSLALVLIAIVVLASLRWRPAMGYGA